MEYSGAESDQSWGVADAPNRVETLPADVKAQWGSCRSLTAPLVLLWVRVGFLTAVSLGRKERPAAEG
ncbi:hypothetical protein PSPO01_09451 [Paraphaeosphaeria sporulosa]